MYSNYYSSDVRNEIKHHGILGMKWGVRRFQNPDGSLTPAGKRQQAKADAKQSKADAKQSKADAKTREKQEKADAKARRKEKRKEAFAKMRSEAEASDDVDEYVEAMSDPSPEGRAKAKVLKKQMDKRAKEDPAYAAQLKTDFADEDIAYKIELSKEKAKQQANTPKEFMIPEGTTVTTVYSRKVENQRAAEPEIRSHYSEPVSDLPKPPSSGFSVSAKPFGANINFSFGKENNK